VLTLPRVSIATESAFEPRSSPSPARSGTRSATPVNTHDLDAEHALRLAAEEKLAELQAELADLSTSLFEQANKMVADERRLRTKCEARMKVLEEQIVQAEERIKASAKRKEEEAEAKQERVERLRKLEERMGRVERVRKTLKGVG
jgi:chromosome segregation ATPase